MKNEPGNPASPVMDQIGTAHLTWKRFLQRGLNQYGLNLKQVYLLRRLSEEQFLYPSRIAEELFCDRPTATVIVRNLESKGWVQKQPDPDDGKRVRVLLSQAGAEKLESVPKSAYRTGMTASDPLECFSNEELTTLESLLTKLLSHLHRLDRAG
ncbi:MAG: MarR family transcriptional regulator [bacterium]|nr:MarR family transcriptional regulator [bacterium]